MLNPTDVKDVLLRVGLTPRAYSGRGMYGKACIGFVPAQWEHPYATEPSDYTIAAVIEIMLNVAEEDQDTLQELFLRVGRDTLGCHTILYFPSLPWDEEKE